MDYSQSRLDHLYHQCLAHKGVVGKDLMHLWRNSNQALARCDQERVNCRRLGKETIRYKELCEHFYVCMDQLEKRITWANIVY